MTSSSLAIDIHPAFLLTTRAGAYDCVVIGLLLVVLVTAGVGVVLSRYVNDMRVQAAVVACVAVVGVGVLALLG
jgi:hypothetical protein